LGGKDVTLPSDPFPISRYLVSAARPPLPSGFTDVSVVITTGLPLAISLSRDISVVLSVPTGEGHSLLEGDPSLTVSAAGDELRAATPGDQPIGSVTRAPVRLYVQWHGIAIGSIPLALGTYWRVSDVGDPTGGTVAEIVVLGWKLALGDLISAGNYGSTIRIGWRLANLATPTFQPPPVDPQIVSILRGGTATLSTLVPTYEKAPSGYSLSGSPSALPSVAPASDGSTARAYEAFYVAPTGTDGA
jgi:hypothetical protein